MGVWRLVRKEIGYRKVDFLLGVVAVFAAVGCLVAVMTLLRAHHQHVATMMAAKVEETAAMMTTAIDDYRKITKDLGYNILILNQDQDLGEFHSNGFASNHMPEEFVTRLSGSPIRTVQHLLPTLSHQITWPERDDYRITLIGVRGEVPHLHSNKGKALLEPVAPGTMRIGQEVHRKLGIRAGDTVPLMGKPFQVALVHDERGNTDDVSVWIHLREAQELLGRPGEVNAILALSCFCAGSELEQVRLEIAGILPEAQVIRRAPQADARAQARLRVAELDQAAAESEGAYHLRLSREREAFAAWLIPLVIVVATVWIGLLALGNVRERRIEIGILRALGLRSGQILGAFLAKAAILGLTGSALGYVVGFVTGTAWGAWEGVPLSAPRMVDLFDPVLLAAVLALAPLQACLASWIPAVLAVQQDPAEVLREE